MPSKMTPLLLLQTPKHWPTTAMASTAKNSASIQLPPPAKQNTLMAVILVPAV
jgi:hypothetical protein